MAQFSIRHPVLRYTSIHIFSSRKIRYVMAKQNDIFDFRELTQEESEVVSKLFDGTMRDSVRVGPKGYFMVNKYKEVASDIYNMELRNDDIFVVSVQRSGTTWTQELVWLVANDLDYEKAASVPLTHRYPFLEFCNFFDDAAIKFCEENATDLKETRRVLDMLTTPATDVLAGMPSPRFVKTHLPMSLLPPKLLDRAKVVYVARDPRDVAVSCYFLFRWFKVLKFKGTFKDMWNAFIKDLIILLPFFEHVKEAWNLRHHPNMLFLFYEELSADMPGSIRRVADFFGKELTSEQTQRLSDHLSFDNFKNNKSVNFDDMKTVGFMASEEKFIRKGKTGGWREYFDEDMRRDAERWIADNLRDTDLRFPSMEKDSSRD